MAAIARLRGPAAAVLHSCALARACCRRVPTLQFSTKPPASNIEEEIAELEAQIERSAKGQSKSERQRNPATVAKANGAVSAFEDISDLDEDLTAAPASRTTTVRRVSQKNAWRQPRFTSLSASGPEGTKLSSLAESEEKLDQNEVLSLEDDTDRINAGAEGNKTDAALGDAGELDAELRQQLLAEVEGDLRTVAATLSQEDLMNASQRVSPEFSSFVSDLQSRARPFQTESSMAALGAGDADELAEDAASGSALPALGLSVDYCIFCHHGSHFLRHDNVALLTKFVSDRGMILPKRFTKCCPKHQRKLATTIKRSRWMNILPWHSKPHPRLRFTSMTPDPVLEADVLGRAGMQVSLGGASAISDSARASTATALAELETLAKSKPLA